MKTVAVAGHPEGTQPVGPTRLWEALRAKEAFGTRTGTQVHVVTRFGFSHWTVFEW